MCFLLFQMSQTSTVSRCSPCRILLTRPTRRQIADSKYCCILLTLTVQCSGATFHRLPTQSLLLILPVYSSSYFLFLENYEIDCEAVDWRRLVQDKDYQGPFWRRQRTFWFQKRQGNLLAGWVIVSFSRKKFCCVNFVDWLDGFRILPVNFFFAVVCFYSADIFTVI